jgi:isopentenyl diphosphate isomerase/L-lactate dehydrogenase-like FMN-dependent dehydrogenase
MTTATESGLQALEDAPDYRPADEASDFQALHEIVRAAHAKLDRNAWDYLVGGSETETTLCRNRQALDSVAFRPRVLRNVSAIDTSATFFGQKISLPVILCPVGSLASFHPNGGEEAARGASEFGVPILVSSSIRGSMEAVARGASRLKVFQLYTRGDEAWLDDYINRAKAAGYVELCVTVDGAVTSRRERDIAKRYVKPWRRSGDASFYNASFSWDDLQRLKDVHKMPMILKGIATAEDAEIACRMGLDAVFVSNHGGRQLDHGRGTLEVLPEIVDAVAGRAKIFIDGGVSRGTDVVKAIALGADAVGIGRLYLYGLAVAGSAGVRRVLELLQNEVHTCLGLLGVTGFSQLEPSHVTAASPVRPPHVHSAFPLLHLEQQRYD